MQTDIVLLLEKDYIIYNIDSHSLIKYFFLKKKIYFFNVDEFNFFINKNKENNELIIFIYIYINWDFGYQIIDILKKINTKNKIYIFTDDFWNTGSNDKYLKSIFDNNINSYKVFCQAPNINILSKYCNNITNPTNIICFPFWCCYDNSYFDENNDVINKVLISGRTWKNIYDERYKLTFINGCDVLDFTYINNCSLNTDSLEKYYNENKSNLYCSILNKYLACFSSSVYETHAILLKTYEILAVGSLLVMPLHEEEFIKKIGLINMHNCWLIDFNINLQEQINNILKKENRYLVDVIRRNGHKLSKELNFNNLFEKILNII